LRPPIVRNVVGNNGIPYKASPARAIEMRGFSTVLNDDAQSGLPLPIAASMSGAIEALSRAAAAS
jgi:hypothetical protein